METSPSPLLESANRVFADTSYLFALLNAQDVNHAAALRMTKQIRKAQIEVVTTWDVVSETATLLRYRLGSVSYTHLTLPTILRV